MRKGTVGYGFFYGTSTENSLNFAGIVVKAAGSALRFNELVVVNSLHVYLNLIPLYKRHARVRQQNGLKRKLSSPQRS